jgi:dephospho-CoA kinase
MPDRIRRVALTGGIATGKSHVRARLAALGAPTIDSDILARDVVAPGTPGLASVVRRFGADILNVAGALDRRRLATIVFADPAARHDLEAIIHPAVQRVTDEWFETLDATRHPFAVADIPLLYEIGRERDFDTVIVVACEPETQVRRVMARDTVTETEARQRLAAQLPIDEKVRRADLIIRTDGPVDDTDRQVKKVYDTLIAGDATGR